MCRLLAAFDSPEKLFQASPSALREVAGPHLSWEAANGIRASQDGQALEKELSFVEKEGIRIVTLLDGAYPKRLKEIADPPPVLYIKGTLLPEDEVALGVVGTRRATEYGRSSARNLSQALAQCGVTVISGLAEGIDAASHEGALQGGGRTIAVLGHGLQWLYPPFHRELAHRVAASGALVSEFPMGQGPQKENFPRRNRIIAGLGLGVLVVEAPLRSGAMITARMALEEGREVFALPGPITSEQSQGTHRLIQQGAKLVGDVRDILEEIAPQLEPEKEKVGVCAIHRGDLSAEEWQVFEQIPVAGQAAVDRLAGATHLPVGKLLPILTTLEMKGLVAQMPGHGFSRVA